MTFEPAKTMFKTLRKALMSAAAFALALLYGISETVALGLARRRLTRYRY
jgi:hypothetical protein